MPLDSDVTLRDLVNAQTLNEPVSYVRGVLGNMMECRKQFGTATVQLGITGEGRSPHYHVSPAPDPDEDVDSFIEYFFTAMRTGHDPKQRYAAFHGMNHERMNIEPGELRHTHWSSERSDFEEVQAMLGELRGVMPRRR